MSTERKVILLGLDGVSLSDLETIVERENMPFFKWLLKNSFKNEPKVMIPYTAPSWTTVATGVNPGKHGIFDFIKPLSNGEIGVVKPYEVAYPRINEILALNNQPSITFNLVFSYPPLPRKENMVVVGSWTSAKPKAWPRKIIKFVKESIGRGPPKSLTIDAYANEVADILEKKVEAQLEIAEKYDWKLCFTVFHEPDWIFHRAYSDFMNRNKPKDASKVFRLIDSFLKKLYEAAAGETMVMLASDHGFMEVRNFLNVNMALKEASFLRIKHQKGLKNTLPKILLEIFQRLPSVKHFLKYNILQIMAALNFKVSIGKDPLTSPIDYKESVAYMASLYYIYVNRRLSEKQRILIRERVIMELNNFKEYFITLLPGNEFFKGPYADQAPDIIIIPKEGFTVSARMLSRKIIDKGRWYVHSQKGLAAVYAPNMSIDKNIDITQLDLVPTALAYLGLPVPHDTEGTIIHEVKQQCENIKRKDYTSTYRNLRKIRSRIKRLVHRNFTA